MVLNQKTKDGDRLAAVVASVWGTAENFKQDTGISTHIYNRFKSSEKWTDLDKAKLFKALKDANVEPDIIEKIMQPDLEEKLAGMILERINFQGKSTIEIILSLVPMINELIKEVRTLSEEIKQLKSLK